MLTVVLVILLATILTIAFFVSKFAHPIKTVLVNPSLVSSSSPVPTPKQYQFDVSTDLKQELESINPQVLDSDFE
ncbi:hypothetical protein HYW41_03250 [Candidatus Daviesbacteria bacterium]|nr:hypothetical protein [Candidatus Daviesbacteria bacterium]